MKSRRTPNESLFVEDFGPEAKLGHFPLKMNFKNDNICFQQDGATCHTAETTLDVLRKADAVRPPRGCDLTPLDYYLWGAAKDKC